MKSNTVILLICVIISSAICCTNPTNKVDEKMIELDEMSSQIDDDDFDEVEIGVSLSENALDAVIKSIPSPLDISDKLIKRSFNEKLIAKRKSSENFIGNHSKAIMMGIYGCDLSYINIFRKNLLAGQYYETVVGLAEVLRVDQFFNLSTIEKLKSNQEDKEKVLEIIKNGYKDIYAFLEDQKRDELSLLMLYGSWLESLYITVNTHDENDMDLSNEIGNQKITVNKLQAILSKCKESKKVKDEIDFLQLVKKAYEKVSISHHYEKSDIQVNSKDDFDLVDVQTKEIQIDKETIKHITSLIVTRRNELVNL